MIRKKPMICAFIVSMTILAGSIIIADDHVWEDIAESLALVPATAQSPSNLDRDLRFPPGQLIYQTDAQINTLTSKFTELVLPPFNMSSGNVVNSIIIPNFGGWLHQEVTPHFVSPPFAFRYVTLMLNTGYDATAPYHETAVGVYSRIENRPASEYENNSTNMNIASMHAAYHLLMAFDSAREDQWRNMLTTYGLDPDDRRGLDLECTQKHTLESPVAIGNLAGKCVIEGRMNDGFNHFGNETNGYPFMDTTGYKPVNSANELVDPSRWQPLIIQAGEEYVGQQFITPQWADTMPYTDINPREIRADPPTGSDHTNMAAYKAQADEVINAVADLDDRKKIMAEYFDNKARGTLFFPAVKYTDNTRDFWALDFLLHIAEFDAGIVAWQEKAIHDAVRPVTAIKYIYGDELVPTFDKKDNSPKMIPASQWESYLPTGDHPEYPSATTCFCAAEAQVWRNWLNNGDTIPEVNGRPGFTGILVANSSIHERSITPAQPVNVTFSTWTEFVNECGESRIYGGVHFRPAVEAAIDICTGVGDNAYEYFQTLLDGTAPIRHPDSKLDPDYMRASPHFTAP